MNVDTLAWRAGWYRKRAFVLAMFGFMVVLVLLAFVSGSVLHYGFGVGASTEVIVDLLTSEESDVGTLTVAAALLTPVLVIAVGYLEVSRNYEEAKAELVESVAEPFASLDEHTHVSVTPGGARKGFVQGGLPSAYAVSIVGFGSRTFTYVRYEVDMKELAVSNSTPVAEYDYDSVTDLHVESWGSTATLYVSLRIGTRLAITDERERVVSLRTALERRTR